MRKILEEDLKFINELDEIDDKLKSRGLARAKRITLKHKSKYLLLVRPLIGPQNWRVASLDVQPDFGVYLDKELITVPRTKTVLSRFDSTTSDKSEKTQFLYDVIAFQFRLIKVDGMHTEVVFDNKGWENNVVIQNPKNPKLFDIPQQTKTTLWKK